MILQWLRKFKFIRLEYRIVILKDSNEDDETFIITSI